MNFMKRTEVKNLSIMSEMEVSMKLRSDGFQNVFCVQNKSVSHFRKF
jgi:hypothetical protein